MCFAFTEQVNSLFRNDVVLRLGDEDTIIKINRINRMS